MSPVQYVLASADLAAPSPITVHRDTRLSHPATYYCPTDSAKGAVNSDVTKIRKWGLKFRMSTGHSFSREQNLNQHAIISHDVVHHHSEYNTTQLL